MRTLCSTRHHFPYIINGASLKLELLPISLLYALSRTFSSYSDAFYSTTSTTPQLPPSRKGSIGNSYTNGHVNSVPSGMRTLCSTRHHFPYIINGASLKLELLPLYTLSRALSSYSDAFYSPTSTTPQFPSSTIVMYGKQGPSGRNDSTSRISLARGAMFSAWCFTMCFPPAVRIALSHFFSPSVKHYNMHTY